MAYVLTDHIISALGDTSEENYLQVKAGRSGLRAYAAGSLGVAEGFVASLMEADFDALALRSTREALASAGIDVPHSRVVFILSSTKGAVEKLEQGEESLAASAQRIALQLGISAKPIVVCNACISGLSALILGSRLIEAGTYDYAVVCGCDCPNRFVISGFQSLKALSTEPCRPFDMDRFGLNLGEAAATIVLGRTAPAGAWQIKNGFIKNDAFHISAPSKTSEGLYKALSETLAFPISDLALVNAHGTATLFNDQMESVAIQRAGLSAVPTNALKGYFGHTLGAAGILETILCMKALDDHTLLATRGFEELGVSGKVNMVAENQSTDKHAFVKMLSGFGGCNATLLAIRDDESAKETKSHRQPVEREPQAMPAWITTHQVRITPDGVWIDGQEVPVEHDKGHASLLTSLYKQKIGDYPKYYKMDGLSRLGFVASELLLQAEGKKQVECDDRAVVLFNHSSSVHSDKKYLESIVDKDNYYPSPSVFVYTLPNIVTGEIAIRNHYHGETSFYILPARDEGQMREILATAFLDPQTQSALTGWIDYEDDVHFEVELYLVELKK